MPVHPALMTAAAVVVIMGTALGLAEAARQHVHAGLLTCQVHGGIGLCTYKPARLAAQRYSAHFLHSGPQGGEAGPHIMVWRVFEADEHRRDLSGTYHSATKKPTFAIGLGGDVLVEGEGQATALQPFSGSGPSGLGAPIHMGQITLERMK